MCFNNNRSNPDLDEKSDHGRVLKSTASISSLPNHLWKAGSRCRSIMHMQLPPIGGIIGRFSIGKTKHLLGNQLRVQQPRHIQNLRHIKGSTMPL